METLTLSKVAKVKAMEETHGTTKENIVFYQPGEECLSSQEGHEHVDPYDKEKKILKCEDQGNGKYIWIDTKRRRSG